MSFISIEALKKRYDGKQVLHGIDIRIEEGAFVVIVGPSGCGKSTLLRSIAGLENISEGTISIGGTVVNDLDPSDRGCAMVFQNYALYPHMSVRDNMAYPLKIAGMAKADRYRKVEEAAAILDLSPYLDRRPAQLSGGQRQRVAMGRAIVREPRVFLFDEPLSNLDAKLRVTMRIEIKRLHKRLGTTSVFVTHDQVEAMTLADVLIVMNGGNVEQIGTPVSIYREPASTFVAGFLGAPAMNLIPARHAAGRITLGDALDANFQVHPLGVGEAEALTLGIRPEDIEVSHHPEQGLAATVELVEELGGSRIAYCALGAQDIAVVVGNQFECAEGQTLYLRFPERSLHMFDVASGQRLRSAWEGPRPALQPELA